MTALDNKFDETTERLAEEYVDSFPKSETHGSRWRQRDAFKAARNSLKESMVAMAKALEFYSWDGQVKLDDGKMADEVIAKLQQEGNWPLVDK
jgi:adenylate kinase family enzyme